MQPFASYNTVDTDHHSHHTKAYIWVRVAQHVIFINQFFLQHFVETLNARASVLGQTELK